VTDYTDFVFNTKNTSYGYSNSLLTGSAGETDGAVVNSTAVERAAATSRKALV
jgi:hypothetical protein